MEARKKKFCKYMSVCMVNGENDRGANSWARGDEKALEKRRCHVRQFRFPAGHGIAPAEITDECMVWLEEEWERYGSKKDP